MSTPEIYGFGFSPFVRKTLVVAREKNIEHNHIPASPMDERVAALHPMSKIPVLKQGDLVLPDSSVISQYLEKIQPTPSFYPSDPAQFGKALWFDEYADTALAQLLLGPTIFELNFAHIMEGREVDQERIDHAINVNLPNVCTYLQSELADKEYLVGDSLSIADIAIASVFQSIKCVDITVPEDQFPTFASYINRIHARPSFANTFEAEVQELNAVHNAFKEKMAANA